MDRMAILLEELAARPPEERAAWLEETDPETRAEILSLAAANDSPGVLEELEAILPAALRTAVVGTIVPDAVADFEIEGFIGAGGMGEVYRARRKGAKDAPLVALKILRSHGNPAIARRFEEERRILARLEHPAIPRFLDGGVTADGVAYIAMELVDGVPIHRWCREHAAPIAERIRLVLSACDAIQYAHQRLIVHRDVKSANILIEKDTGAVRVLDFGIARVMDDEREQTATGHRWMTPSYASPEQIRGDPATTASDVYSLGVVLYELLTGFLPHAGSDRAAIERSVIEKEVTAPSAVVRGIPTDLDTVVLKALAKEPERRYPTVVEFSDDLRRYLAGLPVRARPVTAWYRARKFARRNRAAVGAASIAVAALVLGAAATTLAMLRARETARREAMERARAEATSRFVVGLFAGLDPMGTGREGIPARELLDSGAARLTREFRDQPQIRAVLLDQLGTTYEGIGRIPEAVRLNREALDAQQQATPPDSGLLVRLLTTRARLLVLTGQTDSARRVAQRALELARPARSGAGAEQLRVLALAFMATGQLDSAEAYLARAGEAGRSDTTAAWRDAMLVESSGLAAHHRDWPKLEAIFDSMVTLRTRAYGPAHPQTALVLAERGENRMRLDQLDEAQADVRRARAMLISIVGSRHPYVATMEFHLGRLALRMGAPASAESLFASSSNTMAALYGAASAYRARPLLGIGESRLLLGRLDAVEAPLREVIAISSKPPANQRNVARATSLLGSLALRQGQPARAERLQREAYGMLAAPGAKVDSTLAVISADLALTLRQLRRAAAADSFANIALPVLSRMTAESARAAAINRR
jgi:eukaryotic-like serine/threonine-protein kinase